MSDPNRSQIVPEPVLRAYLQLFAHVSLYVRGHSTGDGRLSDQELFDLMDAIHNIPEMLTAHGTTFTHDALQPYLAAYDERWQDRRGLSLRKIVQSQLASHHKRLEPTEEVRQENRTVFLLQHVHVHLDGEEHIKLIGVYQTMEAACAAIDRLRIQPGFCDFPDVIDFDSGPEESGFDISEVRVDEDHWTSGFATE